MEAYITTISKQRQWDFIARFGPRQLGKTGTGVELTSKEMLVERVNPKKRIVEDEVEEAEEGEKVMSTQAVESPIQERLRQALY